MRSELGNLRVRTISPLDLAYKVMSTSCLLGIEGSQSVAKSMEKELQGRLDFYVAAQRVTTADVD